MSILFSCLTVYSLLPHTLEPFMNCVLTYRPSLSVVLKYSSCPSLHTENPTPLKNHRLLIVVFFPCYCYHSSSWNAICCLAPFCLHFWHLMFPSFCWVISNKIKNYGLVCASGILVVFKCVIVSSFLPLKIWNFIWLILWALYWIFKVLIARIRFF